MSDSALPAASTMFWALANDSVTVAFRFARLPPDAVTSYTEVDTTATAGVADEPPTSKSAASTPTTGSLNVTRHVRLSAFVGDEDGV